MCKSEIMRAYRKMRSFCVKKMRTVPSFVRKMSRKLCFRALFFSRGTGIRKMLSVPRKKMKMRYCVMLQALWYLEIVKNAKKVSKNRGTRIWKIATVPRVEFGK